METFLIEIDQSKHDFFINLMNEFTFIKRIETLEPENMPEIYAAIEESEKDIETGNFISQSDIKSEYLIL